jgi:hypothetical protein
MVEGYNTLLGTLKSGRKFAQEESTRWVLVPAKASDATSQIASMLDKAENNFRRVAKEHSGTPWATMAEGELRNQFGWQWTER